MQVLIHYEAVKLFLKGVPTFNHPQGTPVQFGFGLTDKKLIKFIGSVTRRWSSLKANIFGGGDSGVVNKAKKG